MKKKNRGNNSDSNLVFSTGEDGNAFFNHIKLDTNSVSEEDNTTEDEKSSMIVRVYRDRKQRKGKEATIITGLDLYEDELKKLGKELKSACGSGGTVKNEEILIQGNFVDKIVEILKQKGFRNTKRTGG